jgi:DNA-binding SARP family transcriptional activator/tetratricopeptide (TPR) repeat protein
MALHALTGPVRISDDAVMQKSAASAALRVRLYGDPAVVLPDGRVVALERRAAALLALAALEPGISRLRVASMLWPDSNDPRRNLRQQLLRFRQLFAHPLVEGEATLRLIDRLLETPDSSSAPLLAGFDYEDCEGFQAWLTQQREARRSQRLEAVRQRLAASEAAGDFDAALEAADALLAMDSHLESHHRELMRLNYLRGDTAAGLAAYRRMSEMLAAEYNSRPSAASEQLAAVLQASAPTDAVATVTGTAALPRQQVLPVVLKRPPQLVGREVERQLVQQHWAEGRAVLLEGEAGLGKSRLMAEFLAGDRSTLFASGRPGDAGAPYATLERLLRPLLDDGAAALDAATRETLAHIAPVVASDRDVPTRALTDDTAAAATRAARTVLRPGAMASAVNELLRQRDIQLIALDDLHFADDATLELLAGLVAQDDPARRWLFAGRSAELHAAAQMLRTSLVELQRLGVVSLAALDERAIAAIVDALAIPGLQGAALAGPLLRHTGGNPLFVLETLKHALIEGTLARGELPRPLSVGALIERRLQRLSEPALTLARVAAIAGVDFSIELAESAIGVRAVQLASAWAELQDAQVLRDESFAHDLVSDAVLRSVPPVVARRVHGQCAQWLAAHDVEPARVAWHWRHGGMPAEAGRAFVAAALRAEAAARLQEEAALYGHAAQAFAEAGLDEERFTALVGRVRSLNQARFDRAAVQECHALLATARTDAQRVRAHSELAGLLTERGEPQAALEAGQAAMTLARQLGDHEWQVRTACHMATAACSLGRADEAVALLAPLRAWVDAQPDEALRMLWHGEWGAALGHAGRLREAVAAYDVALDAARRLGLRDSEGRLLLNCSVTLRQSGQFDRALALSRQGQSLSATEDGDAAALPIDRLVLARDESEAGLYSSALPALESVVTEFERRQARFWHQAGRMVLVRLWLDLGQYARAVPLLRDEPDELPVWLRADRRLLQLELARALGQPVPAGVLDEALALAAADPQRGPSLQVRTLRSVPPAQVLAQAPSLIKTLSARERFGALLALHVHVARAALVEGRVDVAASSARAALLLIAEGYAPESMYRPEASLVAAQALAQAGAPAEAAAAIKAGSDWIRSHALPNVPVPFLDSFLHRNPVNRELLAAAARLPASMLLSSSPQGAIAALGSSESKR